MKCRKLGWTDLDITEIGFGAWAVGGEDSPFGWGPQDDNDSIAAIHKALDLGINWIDTAAIYGFGHSEKVVAKAIKGKRKEIIIATKCSRVWDEKREVFSSLKRDSVLRECEESLQRLETDYIDLYQIHWPGDEERLEEGWETMNTLIKSGKVRYGGVSNFDIGQMSRIQHLHPIASLQPPYSMMRRAVEAEIFPYCEENKIGVVAYSPMQAGLLTGRFDRNRIAKTDWRQGQVEFNEPNLEVNLWFVDQLRPIADKYQKTVAQLALSWTLRLNVVTSSIAGARNPQQVIDNVGGSGWTIDLDDLQTIENLLEERAQRVEKAGGVVRT